MMRTRSSRLLVESSNNNNNVDFKLTTAAAASNNLAASSKEAASPSSVVTNTATSKKSSKGSASNSASSSRSNTPNLPPISKIASGPSASALSDSLEHSKPASSTATPSTTASSKPKSSPALSTMPPVNMESNNNNNGNNNNNPRRPITSVSIANNNNNKTASPNRHHRYASNKGASSKGNGTGMEKYLLEAGCFLTADGVDHRKRVLTKLNTLVRQWIQSRSLDRGMRWELSGKLGGKIVTYGSYMLGISHQGADIDALFLAPHHITRHDFFHSFKDLFEGRDGVTELRVIPEAYVPVLKMKYEGIEIDMTFARLALPDISPDLDFVENSILKRLDPKCVRSMNGYRSTRTILELVPNIHVFRLTLRAVKHWAKAQGIYSNVLGYLGGFSWAMLTAKVCMLNPEVTDAEELLYRFFLLFSKWPWPEPVLLTPLQDDKENASDYFMPSWNPQKNPAERYHFMPIITPTFPHLNSTFNVTQSTLKLIQDKMTQALKSCRHIIYDKTEKWDTFFKTCNIFKEFEYFLFVIASAYDPLYWFSLIESKLRHFVANMEANYPSLLGARIWPKPFSQNCNRGKEGGKVIKLWFVGLKFASNNMQGQSLDLSRPLSAFRETLLRHSTHFYTGDMTIFAELVHRDKVSNALTDDDIEQIINFSQVPVTPPEQQQHTRHGHKQQQAKHKESGQHQQQGVTPPAAGHQHHQGTASSSAMNTTVPHSTSVSSSSTTSTTTSTINNNLHATHSKSNHSIASASSTSGAAKTTTTTTPQSSAAHLKNNSLFYTSHSRTGSPVPSSASSSPAVPASSSASTTPHLSAATHHAQLFNNNLYTAQHYSHMYHQYPNGGHILSHPPTQRTFGGSGTSTSKHQPLHPMQMVTSSHGNATYATNYYAPHPHGMDYNSPYATHPTPPPHLHHGPTTTTHYAGGHHSTWKRDRHHYGNAHYYGNAPPAKMPHTVYYNQPPPVQQQQQQPPVPKPLKTLVQQQQRASPVLPSPPPTPTPPGSVLDSQDDGTAHSQDHYDLALTALNNNNNNVAAFNKKGGCRNATPTTTVEPLILDEEPDVAEYASSVDEADSNPRGSVSLTSDKFPPNNLVQARLMHRETIPPFSPVYASTPLWTMPPPPKPAPASSKSKPTFASATARPVGLSSTQRVSASEIRDVKTPLPVSVVTGTTAIRFNFCPATLAKAKASSGTEEDATPAVMAKEDKNNNSTEQPEVVALTTVPPPSTKTITK